MKKLSLLLVMTIIAFTLCTTVCDFNAYAEPPQPSTDTTQNTPGPTVNDSDANKGANTPTGTTNRNRDNRPDYGWLGLLGLTGLFGLAGRRKDSRES